MFVKWLQALTKNNRRISYVEKKETSEKGDYVKGKIVKLSLYLFN
jgi:hypothetical protein